MPPPPRRLEWIDLFRGLAVLGMIWTHSAHTFLFTPLRQSTWFDWMDYYHGLIAPAFFWISGFVRAHVTTGPPKPAGPAVKRLLMVLLIGYLLHFPWWGLSKFQLTASEWREGLKVDVLQCLAVSGLLLLLVERFGRWRHAAALLLLALCVLLQDAAALWQTGLLPLDQYLNHEQGSLFPLFPWVGFGLAGFLTRAVWDGTHDGRSGVLLCAAGALLAFVRPVTHWLGHAPSFFLERLGWLLMAAVVIAFVGERVRVIAATGLLRLAGRESLLLYVAHLVFIYSVPLPKQTLQVLIGPTQPVVVVVLIAVLLFTLCLALGAQNEVRKQRARLRRLART